MITQDTIKAGQDALKDAFIGYSIRYSEIICDMKKCTNGNTLLCSDGKLRRFRRYIDTKKKNVFWCYPERN